LNVRISILIPGRTDVYEVIYGERFCFKIDIKVTIRFTGYPVTACACAMPEKLSKWLEEMGLGEYAAAFVEHAIDEEILSELTDADLEKIGMKLGHRRKLLKAIKELIISSNQFSDGAAPSVEANRGQAVSTFGSPAAYTPKHLVERILAAKSTMEGERKQVTVLFADIKGSTELIADLDPEHADKLLNPALEAMMEAVHRYEGTVSRVLGDGIMALFGAPLAHEDHASRACYAALAMQESMRRYAEQARREQGVTIQIRVGLNSGEVVVRNIGDDSYMEYTAMGQTAHLAARMEQLADGGGILLTSDTLRLAEGYVQVKGLGPVPVKGLTEPVEVYQLTGASLARHRLDAATARGLTRFVGRDVELGHLQKALEQAESGHGQVLAVVGEPGVGKSRLYFEFTHLHRTQGWLVLETGSVSHGQAIPYLPLIDLLKSYFQIEAGDEPRTIRERITGKLVTLDATLMPLLPAFLALMDGAVDDPQWLALDQAQRRQSTLVACKRLLLRESQIQPLIIIFQDLQWTDSETQAFLDGLIDSLPSARVLLLVNYRPEYRHGWANKSCYVQLSIDALSPDSAEELLAALLGADPGLNPLKRLLIERTDRNPLFLEESVRNLVETDALSGARGAYHLERDVTTIEVAPTVQAVLAGRIDRLLPEEKSLLQLGAVIGETIPFILLKALAGVEGESLRQALARLQDAEFLYEQSLFPELEYAFKHGLTRQVAYDSLLQERRRALHAQIADAIEQLYPDRLTENVERLAFHAFRGEVWEKALTTLRQAGVKALTRSANREAIASFEQALVALSHLAESRETLEQAIDLRFELRNSLYTLGKLDRGRGYLREAEHLGKNLGDAERIGWVSVYMCHTSFLSGDSKKARRFGDNATAIAQTLENFPLKVAANLYAGAAYFASGEFRRAADFGRSVVQWLEGDLSRERFGLSAFPAVYARWFWAHSLAELGEFGEGITRAEEAIRIAESLDHRYSLLMSYWNLGYVYGAKGDLGNAARVLEQGLALSQDYAFMSPLFTAFLGHVYALCDRISESLPLFEKGLAALESIGFGLYHALSLVHLGEAYARADRLDESHESARRAQTLARENGQRGWEAYALHLLGEIHSHRDDCDPEAEDRYRQALTLAEALGMRPLAARCEFGLGRLYGQAGRREEAVQTLNGALELFRGMEMHTSREHVERELLHLRQ
jgi:class 3 adenylate cyclase/tetratricopeptide (TPR) repeat protein